MDVKLRNELKRVEGKLVREAETLLKGYTWSELGKEDFGKSQLKNLQNIANQADAYEVVTNFIRYQIGRNQSKGWKLLKPGTKPNENISFGEAVIESIEKTLKEKLLPLVSTQLDEQQQQQVQIELTRRLIGYLSRHFAYVKATSNPASGGPHGHPR